MNLTYEWQEYNAADGYEKTMYDIKLFNGDIVTECWPNAGLWNICNPKGNEKYYTQPEMKVSAAQFVRKNKNW